MELRDFLGNRRSRPIWRFQVKGVLWQLYTGSGGLFVGEDRNLERKEVTFFCIESRTGAVLWRDRALPQPWWVGIETVCNDILLFHMYASPDLPGHRGVVAADVRSGSVLWTVPDARFLGCGSEGVRVMIETQEGGEDVLLDFRTGSVRSSAPAREDGVQAGPAPAIGESPIELPSPVSPESAEFRAIESSLRGDLSPGNLQMPVQVIWAGQYLVLVTHRPNRGHTGDRPDLQVMLHLLRKSTGRVLFKDTVLANAQAETGQTVFVRDNQLYYVQERRTLVAVPLAQA